MSEEKKEKRAWVLRDNANGHLVAAWIDREPIIGEVRKAVRAFYITDKPAITVTLSDEPGPDHCRRYRLSLDYGDKGKTVKLLTVETTPLRGKA